MRRVMMAVAMAGLVAAGLARGQDDELVSDLPAWFVAYLEQQGSSVVTMNTVAAAPLEVPAPRGEDAVRIEIAPDASGGSIAADASDPGGVWAWITGNPIKSSLLTAGSTYVIVQGSRGKLDTDWHGLMRAVGIEEHEPADEATPPPSDTGTAGQGTATAPPGGTAVNVYASDNARVEVNIGNVEGSAE